MHELGLCEAIVGAIEQRAKDRSVARVRVRVGSFHHVHPEAFEQSFLMAATGSVAEDAVAELVMIPARGRCRACGADFESRDPLGICPECGGVDVGFIGGDELILESIEYRA
ncbi:MAG: hydrogenase maturation nickel metallochaperone HypA [Acidimicrobiales bacterium]